MVTVHLSASLQIQGVVTPLCLSGGPQRYCLYRSRAHRIIVLFVRFPICTKRNNVGLSDVNRYTHATIIVAEGAVYRRLDNTHFTVIGRSYIRLPSCLHV